MSKARTQPSAKTGLVFKISIALVLLLAVVLYKLNDYFTQEKYFLAQSQLRTQIIATKTAVSSQLNQLKNILSSYETELNESKMNWVQLDPFFAIAKVQRNGSRITVAQYIGRSGSMGDRWNAAYLEKALSFKKAASSDPIMAQLFRDQAGGKYLAIGFTNAKGPMLLVVGSADYFQKYFDLNRGGKITSLLKTTDNLLAAHSEADYVATAIDPSALSESKYLIEQEEITGTNLIAVNYVSKKGLAAGFVIPWAVVGLILGFGFILIGLLIYSIDPIERKVEKYRRQERDQVFNETLAQNLKETESLMNDSSLKPRVASLSPVAINESSSPASLVERVTEAKASDDAPLTKSTLMAPLQQTIFNLDREFKLAGVTLDKQIQTNLIYELPVANLRKAFENILRNSLEAVRDQNNKRIVIRAYDIEQHMSVIEIKDTGAGLSSQVDIEKLWQPFYTTKNKQDHRGLGLTEALSLVRQAGGDLIIERAEPQGVVVKMIIKKDVPQSLEIEKDQLADEPTVAQFLQPSSQTFQDDERTGVVDLEDLEKDQDLIDIEKVLSLDDIEPDNQAPTIDLQSAMTSQNYKTSVNLAPIEKPQFALKKKTFKVDEIKVAVRRPEKS
ncbi:MAG: HAMP domain-containing histidine kinase [Bdellovibrionaceae bacterium]|nr:HAMP domain-containing histidine kinase [Bdellovibrio sp.]